MSCQIVYPAAPSSFNNQFITGLIYVPRQQTEVDSSSADTQEKSGEMNNGEDSRTDGKLINMLLNIPQGNKAAK